MTEPLRIPLFDAKPPQEPADRRERAAGTVVSLLGHILLLVLFIGLGGHKAVADVFDMGMGDGIGAGPAGGGGGGGSEAVVVTAVDEPPPPEPEPEEKPPEVVPPVIIPPLEPEIKPVEIPPVTAAVPDTMPKVVAAAVPPTGGTGGGQGPGTGTGTGPGTGPGSGGGSGGGEGGGIGSGYGPGTGRGRVMAPSPEVLLIPPPAPGSVRGKEVVVRLSVDATGVVRDAEIIPSTGDRKYDGALKKVALGWRFRAARDADNKPVAVQFDV